MKPGLLIHYGSSLYDKELFQPISNEGYWCKPKFFTGLWTSPVNSECCWKDWCISNDYTTKNVDSYFVLELNEDANILVINSLDDLKKYATIDFLDINKLLDFEALSQVYDCIWLTSNGLEETKYSNPNMYGWDCESVLIMNPNCVKQVNYDLRTPSASQLSNNSKSCIR